MSVRYINGMKGQGTDAVSAETNKRMAEHFGRDTQACKPADIPGDCRQGNPSTVHEFNREIAKQILQLVAIEQVSINATPLPRWWKEPADPPSKNFVELRVAELKPLVGFIET